MGITSRLSVKAQMVLPRAVRDHLGIGPGDVIEYELREGCAVVRPLRHPERPADDPFAVFTEWSGPADEEDYANL